jgi:excisionase family DNA binding protein
MVSMRHDESVEVTREAAARLLSTGRVAELLGVSRQHVVDLCVRGELTFVMVGAHRRVPQADVDELLNVELTQDQERSLWLHRLVAGRIVLDPGSAMDRVRANLEMLRERHPDGMTAHWLSRWSSIIDRGIDTVLDTLTSRAPMAVELRQNSPFAGVISQEDRTRALAAFRSHWSREHAA